MSSGWSLRDRTRKRGEPRHPRDNARSVLAALKTAGKKDQANGRVRTKVERAAGNGIERQMDATAEPPFGFQRSAARFAESVVRA